MTFGRLRKRLFYVVKSIAGSGPSEAPQGGAADRSERWCCRRQRKRGT